MRSSWCWWPPITRSFCVVRMDLSAWKLTCTPSRLSMSPIAAPSASSPVTERIRVFAPSAAQLLATFAAPPGLSSSSRYQTTGTGASGEMRETSPNQ